MVSEKTMRKIYKKAFGREFDDINRRQTPLPIHIAYKVALLVLSKKK